MELLAGYLLLVNLTALALYGFDKRRAVRKEQRISERTLLLIALIGGSLGALVGMYLFRHKTKKALFFIGVPVILCIQLIAGLLLLRHDMHEKTRPSGVVRLELEQIQSLDEDTIQNYISFDTLAGSASGQYHSDSAASAALAFFRHFQYSIEEESISGDRAEVSVRISNVDMHALARDLCLSLTKQRIDLLNHAAPAADTNYFALLGETLSTHDYEILSTDATFHLQKEGRDWIIVTDEQLQNELVSGFIRYAGDSRLLDPEEVLVMYLDKYKSLTADDWLSYLDVHDIFSTYSPDHADELDRLYMEKIVQYFDYRVDSCRTTAAGAEAEVMISSLDMPRIAQAYRAALLEYAATTESITSDSVSLANTSASLLIDAITREAAPASRETKVTLVNDGQSWQLEVDDALTDAFLGSMEEALQVLRETQEDA